MVVCIELVLFKFIPDLGTAVIQRSTSTLADFGEYERTYLRPGSVHHARFLGNYSLYYVARGLARLGSSADPRLHPLRLAAGLLTPLWACVGLLPFLWREPRFAWRAFVIPYAIAVVMGMYVFYPADMPSLACLSLGLFCLLEERLVMALVLTMLVGLFRETAFHMVLLAGLWAVCARSPAPRARTLWVAAFAAAFVAEYLLVRVWFPGPISSAGSLILNPRELFLGAGIWSLTTICSLTLAALFPLLCWIRLARNPGDSAALPDWRSRFFALNCLAFPFWVVFYRAMSGNISEFRILWPAILPCIFGIAYGCGESRPGAVFGRSGSARRCES
jgi:hypothetical protein